MLANQRRRGAVWALRDPEIEAIAAQLNQAVETAVAMFTREEDVTAHAVGLMAPILSSLATVDSWVIDLVDKRLHEPNIGADVAFLLFDQQNNVVKAAFVQAKREEQLRTRAGRWIELIEALRNQQRLAPSSSWMWLYRWPVTPRTTAFQGTAILEFDAANRTAEELRRQSYPGPDLPWVTLGRRVAPRGHDLPEWFRGLLSCRYASRLSTLEVDLNRWLDEVRPLHVLIAVGGGPNRASAIRIARSLERELFQRRAVDRESHLDKG